MRSTATRRQFLLSAASLATGLLPAGLTRAAETDVLTITHATTGRARSFTLAELDTMPQRSFTTRTPWHEGPVTFAGVDAAAFLEAEGDGATTLRLVALNDYVVEADVSLFAGTGAILATRQDGTLMPVTDKGPIFVVFPFDSDPRLQHQTYFSRAVWQLCGIEFP